MTLIIGIPGGLEWILILLVLVGVIVGPILAILFYARNKELNRQIRILKDEKDLLTGRLINKK